MALLIILVLKGWSRAGGLYGYFKPAWNWPITASEISQPYNKGCYVSCFEMDCGDKAK